MKSTTLLLTLFLLTPGNAAIIHSGDPRFHRDANGVPDYVLFTVEDDAPEGFGPLTLKLTAKEAGLHLVSGETRFGVQRNVITRLLQERYLSAKDAALHGAKP